MPEHTPAIKVPSKVTEWQKEEGLREDKDLKGIPSGSERRIPFNSLPWFMVVANPVPTEVSFIPLLSAPEHRVILSLPGSPPYVRILPDGNGSRTVSFVPPENPNESQDLGEVWFEVQQPPFGQRVPTYPFGGYIDTSESTAVRPVVKYNCPGVGQLKFVADLQKPYEATFARLSQAQLSQVCVECGIAVGAGAAGGAVGGVTPANMAAGAAIAAAASADCRRCIKETGDKIIRHIEEQVRLAHEEAQRQQREHEARETRERFREMYRMNEACEKLESWRGIA